MDLSVYSLASGSSGNAIVVSAGETLVLVDAGLSVKQILGHMEASRLDPSRLAAILVSHEHSDHVSGAGALARRLRIPIVCSAPTRRAASGALGDAEWLELPATHSRTLGDIEVESFRVCHDAADPVGFNLYAGGRKVTIATDLGCPLDPEICAGASLVILESNHDEERLERSRYSEALKARIRGQYGHLSNAVATAFICEYIAAHPRTCFWLAHLSGENNSPRQALRTCTDGLRQCDLLRHARVAVARRDAPSAVWHSAENWWQPSLFEL